MTKVQISVIPTLETITNLFTKVDKYYNQDKFPVPEDIDRFFYLRQSILSYLVFSDAFGKQIVDGPDELIPVLKELEEQHIVNFGKCPNIYKVVRDIHTPRVA